MLMYTDSAIDLLKHVLIKLSCFHGDNEFNDNTALLFFPK